MSMSQYASMHDRNVAKAVPKQKPVVQYSVYSWGGPIEVGLPARVIAFDHPSHLIQCGEVVRTSTVQSYDVDTGVFETRNSVYKPVQEPLDYNQGNA